MSFRVISWNAQGIAKQNADYFASTLREQHDFDVAILQEVGYWGITTQLEVSEGDLYLVTPRVEGQKQMGLLIRSRARLYLRGDLLPWGRSAAHHFRIRKKDYWLVCSHLYPGHSKQQYEDSVDELSDLLSMAPPGAYPIVGVDAQTALPPPKEDEERWIGDFPVGSRSHRAEMFTRLLMHHDIAAINTFYAAASGPTCNYDFKHPPAQIDYVLVPARDIWKVSATLEEITDSASSDHMAVKM